MTAIDLFNRQYRISNIANSGTDYIPGIGTENGLVLNVVNLGLALDAGGILSGALDALAAFYAQGNRMTTTPVDLVGFSRGCYLATQLANIITQYGVPDGNTKKPGGGYGAWTGAGSIKIRWIGLISPVLQAGVNAPITTFSFGLFPVTFGWYTQTPVGVPVDEWLDGQPYDPVFRQLPISAPAGSFYNQYDTSYIHTEVAREYDVYASLLDEACFNNVPVPLFQDLKIPSVKPFADLTPTSHHN